MRGIVLAIVVAALLPYCFLDPRIGVLAWLWFGLMNPHLYVWGPVRAIPLAQMIAIAMLAGFAFSGKKILSLQREGFLILILWTIFTLTSFVALEPEDAWRKWGEISKILLMVLVSVCIDWDRRWIYYMTAVIAFSIGLIGIKGAVFGARTGGEFMVMGPEGSFLEGNTAIAIALDMCLPLFLILARDEQSSPRFKMMCYVALFCSGLSALLTYSRGGFLGLLVVAGFMVMKSRYKSLAVPVAAVAVVFVLWFLPQKWFGRMQTIETYDQDQSAMQRVTTWKVLWQFALDHPITGGGFLLYSSKISDKYLYKVLPPGEARKWVGLSASAHSIWIAMLAEHGFIALFFYAVLFFSTFMSLRWLRRVARAHPPLGWMENYGSLLSISFWAFMIAGSFLDFVYFDLFFHLIALVVILKNMARRELATAAAEAKISAPLSCLTAGVNRYSKQAVRQLNAPYFQ
jgi:probable O-glycosylation ligase (exosortase A-associated)